MKLALALLLAIGLAAAGAAFPPSLAKSGFVLVPKESVGDISAGSAYYIGTDNVSRIYVNANGMSADEWKEISSEYEGSPDAGKGETAGGIQHYFYYSGRGEQRSCTLEAYYEGAYYSLDISKPGDSDEQLVQRGQVALDEVLSKNPKLCPLVLILLLVPFAAFLRRAP